MIDRFVKDSSHQIEQLKRAIELKDMSEVTYLSHKLKSSTANLGAIRLSILLGDLEAQHNWRMEKIRHQLDLILSEHEEACRALDKMKVSA